jgi:hypothetical protein
MIRRYSLAIVGLLLLAAIVCAVVRFVPWTSAVVDRVGAYRGNVLEEKIFTGLGLLVLWALVSFMALGERIGIIRPPQSDAISLFDERWNPINPVKASFGEYDADSPPASWGPG